MSYFLDIFCRSQSPIGPILEGMMYGAAVGAAVCIIAAENLSLTNSPLLEAIPDAVNYEKGVIVDDKPEGRPIRKDRQEIIRLLEAFKQREGVYTKTIEINRYDPILVNLLT
ncbi:MAG: hypothetical protein J2P21_00545 [Chloracidobacterium sp.]|nr:hypothetical protein [Chloracidobacterium sp.]